MTAPPQVPVDYRELAWWAEAADGLRNKELVIAEVMQNGSARKVVKRRDELQQGERIVVDGIRTDSTVPGRPAASEVTIVVGGQPIDCRSDEGIVCDSVFCSESAIEKFLFPYYRSQRLLTPAEWGRLDAAFRNPFTVAIGHVHPSHSVTLAGGGGGAGSFYGLTAKTTQGGVLANVKWQSLIP